MALNCQMKSRSGTSWLPSWWRSRDESKRHVGHNPCDCGRGGGLIQLRVEREDLQMPVFTTKVAPTCIIGKHGKGDFSSFPSREFEVKRSSIIGYDDEDGEMSNMSSFSSYDLSHSSSMTPLLPLEISSISKKSFNKKEKHRIDYFDATSVVTPEETDPILIEPLLDLQPSSTTTTTEATTTTTEVLAHEEDEISAWEEQQTYQNYEGVSEPASNPQVSSVWSQNFPNSFRNCAGNFFSRLQPSKSVSTVETSSKVSREEMLRLFILKLDEEANYFDASPSPEEELCECSKCQSYYGEYYARYLEEYQKYGAQLAGGPEEESIEISILMGDLMNNGMNPSCAIM